MSSEAGDHGSPPLSAEALAAQVGTFLRRHKLAGADHPLVVGVSGGPDSVCLLHALSCLKESLDVQVHAAHLDHGLRGQEAEDDALYVADLCAELEVPVTVEKADVASHRRGRRLSLEEAARQVRYGFFARLACSLDARAVLLAHTADDQAETVLMNIVRGSGINGLRGMEAITTVRVGNAPPFLVARPLLEATRKDTEAYCRESGLSPRMDSSNLSRRFLRNRIRLDVMPGLARLNPAIRRSLLTLAGNASQEVEFIEQETSKVWDAVATRSSGSIVFKREGLKLLHPLLLVYLFRRAITHLLGDAQDVEAVHYREMASMANGAAGRLLCLPRGLVFYSDYENCHLGIGDLVECPLPKLAREHPLNIPGETHFDGWDVEATAGGTYTARAGGSQFEACLDLEALGEKVFVTARKPGDRFQPLGMAGPKRLQDFMVDAHIPRHWRERVPLVRSERGIAWVVGWRISEWAKVTEATSRVVKLRFEQGV